MKSYIVKLNKTGQYFQVYFGFLDTIEKFKFTKDKNKATKFNECENIIENKRDTEIKFLSLRYRQFNFFISARGIKKEDITIKKVD